MAHLSSIVRYPVKGLPGVPCEFAQLNIGLGLRYDRALGITNGTSGSRFADGWNPREAYFHVAKNAELVVFETELQGADTAEPAVLTVRPPTTLRKNPAPRIRIRLDDPVALGRDVDAANDVLQRILPPGPMGPAELTISKVGLWDWPGAHLSIINIATLDELARASGRVVDRRRFRANLYVNDLAPWAEFDLVGRRIRVGGVEMEVFQPTDRCRATTIDPVTGLSDLNVPALLAGQFGHMYCGVYARVVSPGRIEVGQSIEVFGERAAPSKTAPANATWPRSVLVDERVVESDSVVSFWFHDPQGLAGDIQPGQHVRVHLPGVAAPSWRCYTVSGTRDDRIRISVKRDGRISRELHNRFMVGEQLSITGPFGDVTPNGSEGGPNVFLSAGIGITPSVAMLRSLAAQDCLFPVRVIHIDRTMEDVALWGDVLTAVSTLADASAELFLTRSVGPPHPSDAATHRRPTALDLLERVGELVASATVYICGPDSFQQSMRRILMGIGFEATSIRSEVFFSPSGAIEQPPREPTAEGPFRVEIPEHAVSVEWNPSVGSLLDAIESIGLAVPSGCRAGVCGTCAQRLRSGQVEYLVDPLTPPPEGSILVCCSTPLTDVVLGHDG
ncbi:MOSC domain-containing protein [Diaminobutyricibacter sp. McL0608]|uniref:MOSC domain-containing protein n=1 Tax=Leifsonia sp. McL0608 TaxID=3143537 RepID=UPI0031F31DE9